MKFNNHNPGEARVLFIYPNERHMSTIPPSIALLSQLLKDNGHRVDLFDTTFYEFDDEHTLSDSDADIMATLSVRPIRHIDDDDLHLPRLDSSPIEDLRAQIEDFNPDLLAVSCTETTFLRGLKLIQQTRDKGVPNIFGGVFPTFAPELVINATGVDMLCVGEGDNALVDLADCISQDRDIDNVTNIWIRQADSTIRKNPITQPVDINLLPPITDIGLFGEKRFYRPMGGEIRRLLPVETHRGCPYTCSFCNSPSQNELYKNTKPFFRKKTIELIKQEIENHIKTWKVEYIYFWADTFLAWSSQEFDEFCEMYQDIQLPFWCQTRIETISEYKFKRLKEVGLDRITFGMEHGNEKFRREVVKRDYSNKDAIRLMQIPADLDITFSVNNIIGFPGETRELAFDTIELNRHFKSDDTSCSVLVPFHGTEIRRVCEKQGLLTKDQILPVSNSDDSVLDMPQWRAPEITKLKRTFSMYVKFPKDRWPEIKRAETDPHIHAQLSSEFIDTFWSNPSGDIRSNLKEAAKGLL